MRPCMLHTHLWFMYVWMHKHWESTLLIMIYTIHIQTYKNIYDLCMYAHTNTSRIHTFDHDLHILNHRWIKNRGDNELGLVESTLYSCYFILDLNPIWPASRWAFLDSNMLVGWLTWLDLTYLAFLCMSSNSCETAWPENSHGTWLVAI